MISFFKRFGIYFAWVISLISAMGSIYASAVLNITPCVFCWYQRIFMFPLVIILAIATYRKDTKIIPYVIVLPFLGSFFALFQSAFLYFKFSFFFCNNCSNESIKLFNFIDMSIASLIAFISVFIFLLLSKEKKIKIIKKK